jgi:predicted nucleotidyltransferase
MRYEEALNNAIFVYKAGSHAYGTNTDTSDEDIRGVFMAPLNHAFNLFQTSFMGQGTTHDHLVAAIEDIEKHRLSAATQRIERALSVEQGDLKFSVDTVNKEDGDEELHEVRKFLKLAADNNPNIIEFLYAERLIQKTSKEWYVLRKSRDLFLSQKAKSTFSGYATAQLRRIENHRGYLLNPPGEQPSRKDFGLPEATTVPQEHRGAMLALPAHLVDESVRDIVLREKKYQAAMVEWKAYQRWSKERNPKRKVMEKKCGYDSKHASHLVRLLRMALEIIRDGEVIVYRPDAKELLDIRQGEWPYEKLMEHVEELNSQVAEAAKTSTLQAKADYEKIADLYREVVGIRYGIRVG